MPARIDYYQGVDLFASNDNVYTRSTSQSTGVDHKVLPSIDVGLFCCLRKLGTPRDRVCSALQISNEEYDYIAARF
jgi:hypothetical protein